MEVCVVALGKIGLPLAVQFASKGHRVHGADINPFVVKQVNDAVEPFPGEHDLSRRLGEVIKAGALDASVDVEAQVRRSEVVVVVVPLIVTSEKEPDFTLIDRATESIGRGLKPGTLVIFETTLPIGTTRSRIWPRLCSAMRDCVPDEVLLCFSPERVFSGRIFADLRRYPKIVGGLTHDATRAAVNFYESALDFDDRPDLPRPNGVWPVDSCEAAEMAKLAETTFRDVNIALANEFAVHAEEMNIDVYQVIEAANSQPFSLIHQPGVAVGGHCIPVYPHLYLHSHRDARLPHLSRIINDGNPERLVDLIVQRFGDIHGWRLVILGLAYRGGVKESAYSGAFALRDAVLRLGAIPLLHDPLYSPEEVEAHGFESYVMGEPCDAVIVQADHKDYAKLSADHFPGVRHVVDGRRILDLSRWTEGVCVDTVGMPRSTR